MDKLRVLVVGKSGRLDALVTAIHASPRLHEIHVLSEVDNSSLRAKATVHKCERTDDIDEVRNAVRVIRPQLAVIGPEEPLEAGVADILEDSGIPCVGPRRALARIEWSKSFARSVVEGVHPELNPLHKVFERLDGLKAFLDKIGPFVVKPDGLTGGKGVRVFGEHLRDAQDALTYCKEILATGQKVIIEEKLDGEEFSLQSLTDGFTTIATPPVQDHKRAFADDTGPNTGGMGSYSCADHTLPFLDDASLEAARLANEAVVSALRDECKNPFRGILYGGFMLTSNGLKLVEYNARFGDPEIMNVLPLLEGDFLEICEALAKQRLHDIQVKFRKKATVCKYVVPMDYPNKTDAKTTASLMPTQYGPDQLKIYFGAVNTNRSGEHTLIGSRAFAFVGIADTLEEAEKIAEEGACSVKGPVRHRADIGTRSLVNKRVAHMREIRTKKVPSAA